MMEEYEDSSRDFEHGEEEENWMLPETSLIGSTLYMKETCADLDASSSNETVSKGAETMSSMELNTNKAGMEGLDKEKINKIIMEVSKGSRFFENQKKREMQTNDRIAKMRQRLAKVTEMEKQAALEQMDETVRELEASRDLSRAIIHLDMDMFYAAVEMRDNPELRDKPMAVGGMGMLSTSNYKARRFGVRAAMPGFIGKKLCPDLVLVPPHFDKYSAVSKQVREILAEYDPNYCLMSLDEAYFDLTKYLVQRQTMSAAQRTFPYLYSNDANIFHGDEDSKMDVHLQRNNDNGSHQQTDFTAKPEISNISQKCDVHVKTNVNNSTCQSNSMECERENSGASTGSENLPEMCHSVQQQQEHKTAMHGVRCRTFGLTCEEVVQEIRFRIEQKTQLTASAGIAPNCMLAKICSDKNKPNGQYKIDPTREAVMEFIKDLPIRKISGIGKVTERMLSALGIKTCTDLYQQRVLCFILFSAISSSSFLRISLGLGSTHVERDGERKSISTERTFREINQTHDLYNKCHELCKALAGDLRDEQLKGKTVTLKLKTVNFEVKTRASSVKTPIGTAEEMFSIAKELLRTEIRACHPQLLRLRLMGVRLSSLQDASKDSKIRQGTLTDLFNKKQQQQMSKNMSSPVSTTTSGSLLACPMASSVTEEEDGEYCEPLHDDNTEMVVTESVPQTCDTRQNAAPHRLTERRDSVDHHNQEPSTQVSLLDPVQTNVDVTCASCAVLDSRQDHSVSERRSPRPSSLQAYTCPICGQQREYSDLESFNRHIDVCLNRTAIQEILQKDTPSTSKTGSSRISPKKKPNQKRSHSGSTSSPTKRRKHQPGHSRTLEHFFHQQEKGGGT